MFDSVGLYTLMDDDTWSQ